MSDTPMLKQSSAGFTMLEVLISIVVIAFGLLGIAGLQAFAVKNNQSANMRTTATALALDMVDRIQANWPGASAGAYNQPTAGGAYTSPVNSCTTSSGCSGIELAATDLSEWSTLVAAALPNGRGIVCLDSTPNDGASAAVPACDGAGSTTYVVKIWWRDDRSATGSSAAAPVSSQRFSWQFITWPIGP